MGSAVVLLGQLLGCNSRCNRNSRAIKRPHQRKKQSKRHTSPHRVLPACLASSDCGSAYFYVQLTATKMSTTNNSSVTQPAHSTCTSGCDLVYTRQGATGAWVQQAATGKSVCCKLRSNPSAQR